MARECKRKADGGVEVRSGNVADRIDHDRDHEPERQRNSDMAERVCTRVDDDRAGAGEDESERAEAFCEQRPKERTHSGSSSRISSWTRPSISSRILRTVSTPLPAGSSSCQSSYRFPG